MQGKFLVVPARESESVKQLSRAITAWDPLLSIRYTRGDSMYGGILTSYGLSIGSPMTLKFRDRLQSIEPGDAVVLAPSVRIACEPIAEFVWISYEGLAPEHLRGAAGVETGFEYFPLGAGTENRSICGSRREVLPVTDLRHRVQYHFVEIENAQPHSHTDMVELYYVLSGTGIVRIGPTAEQLSDVPVQAGQLLAVGPGLIHQPTDGFRMCIWFLYNEQAHRRRVREAGSSV